MEHVWIKANIHYYCREKYYNRMYKITKAASAQYTENVEYAFYRGIALVLEGQVQKGIQELTPLQSNKDVQVGVLLALIFANKLLTSVNREILHSLDSKLKEERKHSSSLSLYYAALFLSLAEKYEKAADYIAKSLKKDANNLNTIILKGWNEIFMNKDFSTSVTDCFDLALSKNERHIECMLGLAKVKTLTRIPDESNLLLDQIIVNNAGEVVPLVEKMKNDLSQKKWDSVFDTMDRIFTMEPNNIEALKTRVFITLCKTGDIIGATDQSVTLYSCLEMDEPMNGFQFYDTSQLMSRAGDKSSMVLSQAYRYIQHASEMYPNNIEYLSEIGHHCLLQGKSKDAHNFFKAASKIDSNSITALCGLTQCQMIEGGPMEQVEQQVELLLEMQGAVKLPVLLLLSAKLHKKDMLRATSYLEEAANDIIIKAGKQPYGLKYVKDLDPNFLMEIYKEYQQFLPIKPFLIVSHLTYNEEYSNSSVNSCFKILETIHNACPGLIVASYELAKLKFLFGFASEGQNLAQLILEIDNTHAGSYILLAQIYIANQMFQKAAQSLEICLSYNFKVRDSAMYHLINGIIQKSTNDNQAALSSFTTSLQIVNGKTSSSHKGQESELNIADKATLYLLLIEVRSNLGQLSEAGKLVQEAIQEFSFTTEEGRLVLAKAELMLKNGDVDRAIDLLNEVKFGQPYYFQAHTKMAYIYLKEKNDRAMFTKCFRDVVSNHPMSDSHVMMGDAYLSINEPALAVEAYESAIAINPNSVSLINKLVSALVKTHHYYKATQMYEESIKFVKDEDLKFSYAELLLKLKQYEKANSFATSEMDSIHDFSRSSLKTRLRYLLVMARAREELGIDTGLLLKQIDLSMVRGAQSDLIGEEQEVKQLASQLLCAVARGKSPREPAVAASLYAEALTLTPREPLILLALATLYAQMNNAERCEQTCSILLNADPNNEAAAVMMADLAFRKVDLDTAQRHLSQIVSVKPQSWCALAQLVEVQWRRGRLADAEAVIEAAKLDMAEHEDEGYYYCAGITAAYSGRVNSALRLLKRCRRSSQWKSKAAQATLLVCLYRHTSSSLLTDLGDNASLAQRTAEKLLEEVEPRQRRSLAALVSLMGRSKQSAERVLQDLLPTATEEEDPYAILAIANAYNILKQPTRAKNILKRTISSIPWTPERADGLERCWLEVVEQQVGAGRSEAARELLGKLIAHNKSCTQAYQYLGHLSEKEQNYKQATVKYENSWSYGNKCNYTVGYKLAYCYLKLKKYPEAIVVCRHILKDQPDYPKLRKEIFDKAKNNLRT